MKLAAALLCVSCDEVHTDPSKCPWCGDTAPPFAIARAVQPKSREEIDEAARLAIAETPTPAGEPAT